MYSVRTNPAQAGQQRLREAERRLQDLVAIERARSGSDAGSCGSPSAEGLVEQVTGTRCPPAVADGLERRGLRTAGDLRRCSAATLTTLGLSPYDVQRLLIPPPRAASNGAQSTVRSPDPVPPAAGTAPQAPPPQRPCRTPRNPVSPEAAAVELPPPLPPPSGAAALPPDGGSGVHPAATPVAAGSAAQAGQDAAALREALARIARLESEAAAASEDLQRATAAAQAAQGRASQQAADLEAAQAAARTEALQAEEDAARLRCMLSEAADRLAAAHRFHPPAPSSRKEPPADLRRLQEQQEAQRLRCELSEARENLRRAEQELRASEARCAAEREEGERLQQQLRLRSADEMARVATADTDPELAAEVAGLKAQLQEQQLQLSEAQQREHAAQAAVRQAASSSVKGLAEQLSALRQELRADLEATTAQWRIAVRATAAAVPPAAAPRSPVPTIVRPNRSPKGSQLSPIEGSMHLSPMSSPASPSPESSERTASLQGARLSADCGRRISRVGSRTRERSQQRGGVCFNPNEDVAEQGDPVSPRNQATPGGEQDDERRQLERLQKLMVDQLKQIGELLRREKDDSKFATFLRSVVHRSGLKQLLSVRETVSGTEPTQGKAKAVALAADIGGGPSKFDAADQVKGQTGSSSTEYDKSPQMLHFYPEGYTPPTDQLQTVDGFKYWNDPKGRLWPEFAIERLTSNCSMMVHKHAHGEPRAVVVPLFAYSTFMFERQVWALWVPVRKGDGIGGRWVILPPSRDLELSYWQWAEAIKGRQDAKRTPFDFTVGSSVQHRVRGQGTVRGHGRSEQGEWYVIVAFKGNEQHRYKQKSLYKLEKKTARLPDKADDVSEIDDTPWLKLAYHAPQQTSPLELVRARAKVAFDSFESGEDDDRREFKDDWLSTTGMQCVLHVGEKPDTKHNNSSKIRLGDPSILSRAEEHWAGLSIFITEQLDFDEPEAKRNQSVESMARIGSDAGDSMEETVSPGKKRFGGGLGFFGSGQWFNSKASSVRTTEVESLADKASKHIVLARYAVPEDMLSTPMHPLADNTIWLPPAAVLLTSRAEHAMLRYASDKGAGSEREYVLPCTVVKQRTKADERPLESPRSTHSEGDHKSESVTWTPQLHTLPPPGLLEYIFSKRSDEVLFHAEDASTAPGTAGLQRAGSMFEREDTNASKSYVFRCRGKFHSGECKEIAELVRQCHTQRNQQQYNETLHEELTRIIQALDPVGRQGTPRRPSTDQHEMSDEHDHDHGLAAAGLTADMLQAIVQLKCGANAQPSPLNIVHSLDLQEVSYGNQSWTVAFSGKPYTMATAEAFSDASEAPSDCSAGPEEFCLPMYRCMDAFNDQPYWHMNCSMRNLQFQKDCGSLNVKHWKELKKGPQWQSVYLGRERKRATTYSRTHENMSELWDMLSGKYKAPQPEAMCGGIDTLACVSSLNNSGARATYDLLRQRTWQVTFRHTPRVAGLSNCRVTWHSEDANRWRDKEEAEWVEELCTPYRHAGRESGKWVVRGTVQRRKGWKERESVEIELAEDWCWLDLGTWMLTQCRPLIFHIAYAMCSMRTVVGPWRCAPEEKMKLYRGLGGVTLDANVYARGKVLLWGQYSSSSKDQGVAQSFAKAGKGASVFTLDGRTCRLIAPWSRFGREEEWLFPLNTLWQLKQLLTEEQQQILGKGGLQLYEMEEVEIDVMHLIQVRSVLSKATSAASAGVIFQCESSLETGGGILNLALATVTEGQTACSWSYRARVMYDATESCTVRSRAGWTDCDPQDAEKLRQRLVDGKSQADGGRRMGESTRDTGVLTFRRDTQEGAEVLQLVAKALKISVPHEVCYSSESDNMVEFKVRADEWEVDVELRRRPGRKGNAVQDEGAKLLAQILYRGVPLKYIDLRNNSVGPSGAVDLLNSVRQNRHILQLIISNAGQPAQLDLCHCWRLGTLHERVHRFESRFHPNLDDDISTHDTTDPALQDFSELTILHACNTDLTRLVQAVNLRCMQHQGQLTVGQLEEFGPGWPLAAAQGLYDMDRIDADFDRILSLDSRKGTNRVEQFVMLLAEQCILMGNKATGGSCHAFPMLPGALVAAAIFSGPDLLHLLLDMGASVQEIDAFGETASIKIRRRPPPKKLSAPGGVYCWNSIVQRLHTPMDFRRVMTPPGSMTDNHEVLTWRTKKFALEVVRLWHDKQNQDVQILSCSKPEQCPPRWPSAGILDELLQNFVTNYHRASDLTFGSFSCPLQSLRQLAGKLLAKCRTSSIAKTPISRVGVTLLCFHFFTNTCDSSDSDRNGGEGEGKDGKLDLHSLLKRSADTIFQPGVSGTLSELPEEREKMKTWCGVWSLLGCVLTMCERRQVHITTTLNDLPIAVFVSHLGLKKGDMYALPGPSLWKEVPAPAADHKPTRRRSVCPPADEPGKQPPPEFTRVTLTASGKVSLEDVASIVGHPEYSLCLPALSMFVVCGVDFCREDCSLQVQLYSKGSLLESDAELRGWRDDVLAQAERAEQILDVGQSSAGDGEALKIMDKLKAWKEKARIAKEVAKAKLETARKRNATRRKRNRDLRGEGKILYVCSEESSMKAPRFVDRDVESLVKHINMANVFNEFKIQAPGEQRIFTNGYEALMPDKGFPYTKRPACTLLSLVGRSPHRKAPLQSHMLLDLNFDEPIMDRVDFTHELTVNGETIDDYYRAAHDRGELDEPWERFCAAKCPEGHDGPSARTMFGPKSFSIMISAVQQCVGSTMMHTSRALPRLFILDLVRRFGVPREACWLLRAFRASPLKVHAQPVKYAEARHTVMSLHKENLAAAQARLEGFRKELTPPAMRIVNNEYICAGIEDELMMLETTTPVGVDREFRLPGEEIRRAFQEWMSQVRLNPAWWGFTSDRHVDFVFSKSPVELSTEVCVSQQGYFITDGRLEDTDDLQGQKPRGWHNQICEKTNNPVVFLCAPGIDFCFALPTLREGNKYFVRDPAKSTGRAHMGWVAWLTQGQESFHKRVKELYRTIFSAARAQGVRNPSMLPLGLGVFLDQLNKLDEQKQLREDIQEHYFRVQFELLSEQDWGFENYFINAQRCAEMATNLLERETLEDGDYNCPSEGIFLRCNIVFHNRDAKFLAHQLAVADMAPAFLNPSDSQAVIHGLLGMYWEMGRGVNYVGEEDWAACSTGPLMSYTVAHTALGLDDVVFQLQNGNFLHVSKVCGNRGLMCISCCDPDADPSHDSATVISKDGPFLSMVCSADDIAHRRVHFLYDADGKKKKTFALAAITELSLRWLLGRVLALQRCGAHERPEFAVVPTQYKEDEVLLSAIGDSSEQMATGLPRFQSSAASAELLVAASFDGKRASLLRSHSSS